MSSFVIGLDISDSHVTSALVRVGQTSKNSTFSIERDTYFTRSSDNNVDTDPRDIISTWIECVDDLLLELMYNYQNNDTIDGISIGLPGPMNYDAGICHIQSPTFHKFFGLNLRLSFENGLRNLISRWKKDYYERYYTPSIVSASKKVSFIDELPRRMTITPPNTPHYCGRHDLDDGYHEDEVNIPLPTPLLRRETYFHDIEFTPVKQTPVNTRFNLKFWTLIEQLADLPITFSNDAVCFALGELNNDYNQTYERVLALTLSTSFGSAFIDEGQIIINREDVPPDGTLGTCPYDQHSIADDWFSTRGLINMYKKLRRHESPDDSSGTSSMSLSTDDRQNPDEDLFINDTFLIQRASNGDPTAIQAFRTFARLLGQFLISYVNAFRPHLIIVGGSLVQVWYLLEEELASVIRKFSEVHIYFSLSQSKSICLGSVEEHLKVVPKNLLRQTHQNLLPVRKNIDTSQYDLYPSHQIPIGFIGVGFEALNDKLIHLIEENDILLIDGFVGTHFDEYAQQLNKVYSNKIQGTNLSSLLFYDSGTLLQTDSNMERELYLKDPKSLFGKVASNLDFRQDFLDLKKLSSLQANLSYPCVVIGPGSSYVNETSPLIYIDLPKSELYDRIAAQTSFSYLKPKRKFPLDSDALTSTMYEKKCLYFLDYPVFSKLKQELLSRLTYFVDSQRPYCPTWIEGETYRQALAHLANQPVRVRPWFASGPWGGQWLKSVCTNLSKHVKNYAWCMEMITSESGLILSDADDHLLETSWDAFYGSQADRILGNDDHYRLFNGASDFPLRLNFLDSLDGENLPIECNPNLQYMRTNFGEKLPQDETYYIVETKQRWKDDPTFLSHLYLGFRGNVNPDDFHHDLIQSDQKKTDFNVEKYIQRLPTEAHDFFLVPNEVIHASGRHQVVLEISSAPYRYTFQFYDWLRLGSDDRTRPLSIEQGMENLKFDRQGEPLRCQPIRLHYEQDRYEEQHLPTHELYFYDVQRLIMAANESIELVRQTENRFHLCMLVEGDAIEIQFDSTDNNQEQQIRRYNYIETFLIPASIKEYRLRPIIKNKNNDNKSRQFILLVAFLKWDCEKLLQ